MSSCRCFIPFIIFALIVILFVVGIMIANIIYFVRLRDGNSLSMSENSSMIWISAIVLAAAFAVGMWAVYLMFKCMKNTYDCSYGLDMPDVKISINEGKKYRETSQPVKTTPRR